MFGISSLKLRAACRRPQSGCSGLELATQVFFDARRLRVQPPTGPCTVVHLDLYANTRAFGLKRLEAGRDDGHHSGPLALEDGAHRRQLGKRLGAAS